MKRTLHLSISAGAKHVGTLARLDARYSSFRRAVMVYEQFVCTEKAQTPERVLSVDAGLVASELARLAPRVRAGDVLVANIEDGHPFYGAEYARACGTFASAVRRFRTVGDVVVGSGCYGLFKANQNAAGLMVWHAKHPWQSLMVDVDKAADAGTQGDTHLVGEFYLANVSTTDAGVPGGVSAPGRVKLSDQRAWIHRDLQRLRYYACGRPVLAFVNPVYRGEHALKGRALASRDVRLLCEEIAGMPGTIPVLWMHLGDNDEGGEASVGAAVGQWNREWQDALARLG